MQIHCRLKYLTLGGFITVAHDVWNGKLAERFVSPTMPLPSARKAVPTAGPNAGFPVRIIAKWRAAIASRVPVGYEDETGFHYGVKTGD
jgi:hypothetical protein